MRATTRARICRDPRGGSAKDLLDTPSRDLEDLLESDDGETSVDLDKAWHGIHWLLSGAEGPAGSIPSEAIFGGEPVGEDLGYGPGRLLPPSRVSAVAAALHDLDIDTLRSRMDPTAMTRAGIYPSIWDEGDVFDAYLAPAYAGLRAFYSAAAEAGESVIQTIC